MIYSRWLDIVKQRASADFESTDRKDTHPHKQHKFSLSSMGNGCTSFLPASIGTNFHCLRTRVSSRCHGAGAGPPGVGPSSIWSLIFNVSVDTRLVSVALLFLEISNFKIAAREDTRSLA